MGKLQLATWENFNLPKETPYFQCMHDHERGLMYMQVYLQYVNIALVRRPPWSCYCHFLDGPWYSVDLTPEFDKVILPTVTGIKKSHCIKYTCKWNFLWLGNIFSLLFFLCRQGYKITQQTYLVDGDKIGISWWQIQTNLKPWDVTTTREKFSLVILFIINYNISHNENLFFPKSRSIVILSMIPS